MFDRLCEHLVANEAFARLIQIAKRIAVITTRCKNCENNETFVPCSALDVGDASSANVDRTETTKQIIEHSTVDDRSETKKQDIKRG